jgi:hypothetical protein
MTDDRRLIENKKHNEPRPNTLFTIKLSQI